MSERKSEPLWYDHSLPDQMNDSEDPDVQLARFRLRGTSEGYRSSIDRSAPVKLKAWDMDALDSDINGWEKSTSESNIDDDTRLKREGEVATLKRLREKLRSLP